MQAEDDLGKGLYVGSMNKRWNVGECRALLACGAAHSCRAGSAQRLCRPRESRARSCGLANRGRGGSPCRL